MKLDTYLEELFGRKVAGANIIIVARKTYKKCLGRAQSSMPYNEASVYCHSRRLSFLRLNLNVCYKSYNEGKCKEIVGREIERIEDILRVHKNRLATIRNEN